MGETFFFGPFLVFLARNETLGGEEEKQEKGDFLSLGLGK